MNNTNIIPNTVAAIVADPRFAVFGGGRTSDWNPLTRMLAEEAPVFAAGVSVEDVVAFVVLQVTNSILENDNAR